MRLEKLYKELLPLELQRVLSLLIWLLLTLLLV